MAGASDEYIRQSVQCNATLPRHCSKHAAGTWANGACLINWCCHTANGVEKFCNSNDSWPMAVGRPNRVMLRNTFQAQVWREARVCASRRATH